MMQTLKYNMFVRYYFKVYFMQYYIQVKVENYVVDRIEGLGWNKKI